MIAFSDLLPRLAQVEQLGARDFAFQCPRCGGRASVRSFGRGWSAECGKCGKLGEDDFRGGRQNGLSHETFNLGSAGSNPVRPTPSAAQPGLQPQKDGDSHGSPTIQRGLDVTTASVGEADAEPEIHASEEVSRHQGNGNLRPDVARSEGRSFDNAAPAAGVNGAGGGRSYQPNFTHRDTTAEDYGAPPQPERTKTQPRAGKPASRSSSAADDILRRVPPHNLDAEMSVLGAVFLDNEAVATALKTIGTDDFYRESHREIFRGMVELRKAGVAIDMVTLSAELRRTGVLEAVGGAAYLGELANFVPTSRNTPHYAEIVKAMAIKRDIATKATMLASLAYDGVTVPALIGEMERVLTRINDNVQIATVFPEPLTASQWYAREEELYSRVRWIWDNILEGGGISVLAGKKGAGKSTFVRTLMLSAARGWAFLGRNMQESRVWYIDLEPGGSARKKLMEDLGWSDNDNLHISTSAALAGKPGLFEWLKKRIIERRYDLVVVDTMYKLLKIEGTNDYDKGIYGQVPIEEICRETGCHFMLIHHARKNPSLNALSSIAEEILGSVSVAATAGTVMLVRRRGELSTFQMDPPRYGEAIEGEVVLKKINSSGWVEDGGSWGNQWFGWAKAAVLAALNERGADWSKSADIEVIDVAKGGPMNIKSKTWLLGKLYDEHRVERSGEGKKGDPYRFRKASEPTIETPSSYKDN